MSKIRTSELFYSVQGEGPFTGVPTLWVRFFTCNLTCGGFGQAEPTKPETWVRQYEQIDIENVETMEDLPVLEYGCDSAYSWAKKFRHLAQVNSAEEIVDKLYDMLPEFRRANKEQPIHLCFTGGEPMLFQRDMVEIAKLLQSKLGTTLHITIETNATKPLKTDFIGFFGANDKFLLSFSVSPKMFAVSGEPREKAHKPNIARDYFNFASSMCWTKYVVNLDSECWKQVHEYAQQMQSYVKQYVMPVGATKAAQMDISQQVADKCLQYGYYFSTRLQNFIYDNAVGK